MRRSSPEVEEAGELAMGRPAWAQASLDPELIIAKLEPLATAERRRRLVEVIGARLTSVTVVMDDPYDPHNGAAVLRSCDAFGVQTLHVVERQKRFALSTSVARGSQKWVDVTRHVSTEELSAELARSAHELVATDPDGELAPGDLSGIPRLAIVLGNERAGIAPELRACCTRTVRVPMRGFVESLNVSVCAAILLAAATAGRPGDLPAAERRRLYARGLLLSVPRAAELVGVGT